MGTLTYEIGSGQMPKWVACKVMAYRKMDGSTAYEFWGGVKRIDLRPGDLLQTARLPNEAGAAAGEI